MTSLLGRHAIVVGAEIGGLTAAKALSSYFGTVTVLERDALPPAPIVRTGTPKRGKFMFSSGVGGRGALETNGQERDRIGPMAAKGSQELCEKSPPLLGIFETRPEPERQFA